MTVEELVRRLADPQLTILDVRSPGEFSGELGYPCDPRQGHVPGARNVPVAELVRADPDELPALVGAELGAEVVAYCHSGVRSHRAATMLAAAGYEARNYEGSWHEWSHREDLPTET